MHNVFEVLEYESNVDIVKYFFLPSLIEETSWVQSSSETEVPNIY